MQEVQETLATFQDRISRLEHQFGDRDIIISSELNNEFLLDGDDLSIRKEPILWNLSDYHLFYVITVPPGKSISKHSHDEAIFRYLAQGSLLLNKTYKIEAGNWFVVKAGVPYEIETDTGYVTFGGYGHWCQTRRGAASTHVIEGT